MLRLRALAARLLVLAVGTMAVLVSMLPAGGAAAAPVSCSVGSTCDVANASDLTTALEAVDQAYDNYTVGTESGANPAPTMPATTTIVFTQNIQISADLPFVNGPVVINGQGNSLTSVENSSGVPEYRGLLLYNSLYEAADCAGGQQLGLCQYAAAANVPVTVENLTIANTAANGGNGGEGAGGGAGLGGAIFVGHGVALTLAGDSFSNNSANGGRGGGISDPNFPANHGLSVAGGGGGGMGGNGGTGGGSYGAGGGGLGAGAYGGDGGGSGAGGAGIAYGLESGGSADLDPGTCTISSVGPNAGGAYGGGGGGGGSAGSAAGGGGLSGGGDDTAYEGIDGEACGNPGGAGIGGGGGGGFGGGGDSVFGGGDGFPNQNRPYNGFAGGSAGSISGAGASTDAGFGAGNGNNNATAGDATTSTAWAGGGGGAMGGAVFVQMGATVSVTGTLSQSGATVAGGAGGCSGSTCGGNGSADGSAIFLQGDGGTINSFEQSPPYGIISDGPSGSGLSFSPAAGQTQTIANNVADQNSYTNDSGLLTPWTLVLNGAGTLDLAGQDRFGGVELDSGTLVVPTSASLTSNVTINSGAEMILAGTVSGNVTLNSGGTLCAGQMPSSFTNHGGTVTTNCTTPPSVSISSPGSGGSYSLNQAVPTTFSCSAGINTQVKACVDSNGTAGAAGTLNTSVPGVFTYTVTATDFDGKTATASITYTVISPCRQTVAFGLVQITVPNTGCLQPSAGGDSFSTPGPLTINGLNLPALPGGAVYVAGEPTAASPGGTLAVQAPSVDVNIPLNIGGPSGVTFNIPAFTWNLPTPPAGGLGSATVKTLSMDPTETLKGMKVGGSVTFILGKDSTTAPDNYYASFVFTVELPNMFKSGPTGNSAGLTGTAAVRVDMGGAHFDGLKIQVNNAYIGTLQVKSACFAYEPAGSTGGSGQCPAPAVPATPLGNLTCTNAGGDNWSGSADIVLPTSGSPELSLYGDVAGGSLNALSAQASNLKIALADDVFLTSVGVSLCLPNSTEPFAVQGNVTLGGVVQPGNSYLVNINGSFRYQDPWQGQPWSLGVSGQVSVKGTEVGQGAVAFSGSNYLYFEVGSNMNWAGIASIYGFVEGWLETQSPYDFNVQGSVGLNITDIGSFNGTAAVSTKGVAACATVGGLSYWEPVEDSDWVWYEPWKIHWVQETVTWQAGVGYYWGDSSPSIWPTSCDIGNYELATPVGVEASAGAHAAASTNGFKVTNARAPMSVKISGAGGAPIVKLKTPSGRVIMPPAAGKVGEKIRGVGMLFENKKQHATTVLLTSPAAGAWHVIPVAGSVRVTRIQTAKVLPPPEVVGAAKSLKRGRVGLGVAYSLPAGEKMTLYSSGPHRTQQVIGVAKGKACPGHRSGPSRQLCEHITFKPTYGPNGRRTIYGAVVNSKRLPVATVKIATIRLRFPKPAVSKPAILRKATSVEVEWLPVTDAAKYAVSVVLSDGRKLSYTVKKKVSQRVSNVAKADAVTATVYPVMPDGVIGKPASVRLKANAVSTVKRKKKHKHKQG